MSLRLYMDVHVQQQITDGLRLRNVDVLTAQEDGAGQLKDNELLDRSTQLGRIIFTEDEDFLTEAAADTVRDVRLQASFTATSLGSRWAERLMICSCWPTCTSPEDMADLVLYLPLK